MPRLAMHLDGAASAALNSCDDASRDTPPRKRVAAEALLDQNAEVIQALAGSHFFVVFM